MSGPCLTPFTESTSMFRHIVGHAVKKQHAWLRMMRMIILQELVGAPPSNRANTNQKPDVQISRQKRRKKGKAGNRPRG